MKDEHKVKHTMKIKVRSAGTKGRPIMRWMYNIRHDNMTKCDFKGGYSQYRRILKERKKLYLTPNRQIYNASHIIYTIRAIYTHAYAWTHVHKHSRYNTNNKLIIYFGVGDLY